MKASIAILFFLALPLSAMSQQSSAKPSNEKDCPLSHWSTTGAACFYAPDMPDVVETSFKLHLPTSSNKQELLRYSIGGDSSHRYLFIPTTVPDSIANKIRLNFDSTWDNLRDYPMQIRMLPR